MAYVNVAMTAADITKWIAYGPCRITKMSGMNNQGTTLYIQLHAIPPLAAGGIPDESVPYIKSLQVLANAPFAFTMPFSMPECTIAISTDELDYNAVAASGGLDMTVEIDTEYLVTSTMTVVGDMTTQVSTRQIWTQATGNATKQRLLRVDVVETANASAGQFVQMYGQDTGSDFGSLFFIAPLTLNTTTTYYFGRNFTPTPQGANPNGLGTPGQLMTAYNGCTIARSPNNNVISSGSDQMAIRAIIDQASLM